jgi:hypothetical protein
VSYEVLIALNEEEEAHRASRGRAYISELAEAINYSARGARGSSSKYKIRTLWPQHGADVLRTIEAWRRG